MRKWITIAAYVMATAAFAAERLPCKNVTIENLQVAFVDLVEQRLTITEACRSSSGDLKCKAAAALKKVSLKGLSPTDQAGGNNPGSALCLKVGGEVVDGVDSSNDHNSFCKFSDRSMVDCGSLYFRARQNDAHPAPGQNDSP